MRALGVQRQFVKRTADCAWRIVRIVTRRDLARSIVEPGDRDDTGRDAKPVAPAVAAKP
jgi:hypothetical protein